MTSSACCAPNCGKRRRGPDPVVRACLVDVYDTIITSDFTPRLRALSALAGADTVAWARQWLTTADERGRGEISMADSFERTLLGLGIAPRPGLVADLVRTDAELLREGSALFGDAASFLGELRSRGTLIALVSNCSQSTRQMLEHLAVTPLVDAVILSCEVGSLKPSPGIYRAALAELGVAPAEAVMIDDQARFCAGARAVGVRGIQIARDGADGKADDGVPVVRTLLDVPGLLWC